MKILGFSKLKPRTRVVTVGVSEEGEPIRLTVAAPSLGVHSFLAREIPDPEPPMGRALTDERGRALRDAQGRVKTERLTDDPAYLKELGQVEEARTIAMVIRSLGDQIEHELKPEDFRSRADYYLEIVKQLEAWGLDLGAWKALSRAVVELCDPQHDELAEASTALGDGKPGGNGRGSTGA